MIADPNFLPGSNLPQIFTNLIETKTGRPKTINFTSTDYLENVQLFEKKNVQKNIIFIESYELVKLLVEFRQKFKRIRKNDGAAGSGILYFGFLNYDKRVRGK